MTDYRLIRDPLIASLLASGAARPDRLRLGFDVGSDCALVGANGRPSPRLHALGPPTRGLLWEITAVPNIRNQREHFARCLVKSLEERRLSPL